jgi:hypothetical protein
VVFTGLLSIKKPGEYLYLSMDEDPLASDGSILRRGHPPYERMGSEILFKDLPEGCKRLVLDVYVDLWSIREKGDAPRLLSSPVGMEGAG